MLTSVCLEQQTRVRWLASYVAGSRLAHHDKNVIQVQLVLLQEERPSAWRARRAWTGPRPASASVAARSAADSVFRKAPSQDASRSVFAGAAYAGPSPDSTAATASASSVEAPVARAATGGVIACLGGDRHGLAKGRRAGDAGGDLPCSRVRAFRSNPSPATSRSDFGDARALPGDRRTLAGEACTSTTSTLMSIQFESSDETSSASSR